MLLLEDANSTAIIIKASATSNDSTSSNSNIEDDIHSSN